MHKQKRKHPKEVSRNSKPRNSWLGTALVSAAASACGWSIGINTRLEHLHKSLAAWKHLPDTEGSSQEGLGGRRFWPQIQQHWTRRTRTLLLRTTSQAKRILWLRIPLRPWIWCNWLHTGACPVK